MAPIVDRRFRSKIKVFKWHSTLFVGNAEVSAVFLIRSTSNLGQEITALPFTKERLDNIHSASIPLSETMNRLPILSSCRNIHWFATNITLDLSCKCCLDPWYRPDGNPYVFFFDLAIYLREDEPELWEKIYTVITCICNGREYPSMKVDTNLENGEQIEEYLKTYHGMMPIDSSGMKEIVGKMEVDVSSESEEKEALCPICLQNICMDERFAKAACSHKYHRNCILLWMCENKRSCPMCRSSFDERWMLENIF